MRVSTLRRTHLWQFWISFLWAEMTRFQLSVVWISLGDIWTLLFAAICRLRSHVSSWSLCQGEDEIFTPLWANKAWQFHITTPACERQAVSPAGSWCSSLLTPPGKRFCFNSVGEANQPLANIPHRVKVKIFPQSHVVMLADSHGCLEPCGLLAGWPDVPRGGWWRPVCRGSAQGQFLRSPSGTSILCCFECQTEQGLTGTLRV